MVTQMWDFEKKIFRYVQEHNLIQPHSRILIACSGGVDSVALLHFFARQQKVLQVQLGVIHIDHQLRGEQSAEDGRFVSTLCNKYNFPFYGEDVPIPKIMEEQGGNVQAICRMERYKRFEHIMRTERYDVLVTAHHAEDQLETMLMQLTKGQMPSGMPVVRKLSTGQLVRPFFPVLKQELYTYVAKLESNYREDPSNSKDDYLRNRFRHHIVPFLTQENPQVASLASELAAEIQENEKLLDEYAIAKLEAIITWSDEQLPSFIRTDFVKPHVALQKRMITLLLNYLYRKNDLQVEITSSLRQQLFQQVQCSAGHTTIDLPHQFQFIRQYDQVTIIRKTAQPNECPPQQMERGSWYTWGSMELFWDHVDDVSPEEQNNALSVMYFDGQPSDFPFLIRQRMPGDRMQLRGMEKTKKLARLFIDEKIDQFERDRLPVITTAQGEVCAIPSVRFDVRFSKHRENDEQYIFLTNKRKD